MTGSSADGRSYPCSLNCIPNLDTVVFYVIELTTGKVLSMSEPMSTPQFFVDDIKILREYCCCCLLDH